MKHPEFAAWLEKAMVHTGLRSNQLAEYLDVSKVAVSNWLTGKSLPDRYRLPKIRELMVSRGATDFALPKRELAVPTADYRPGWPEGWQARTYRLALEAAEKGATEEEIAVVRGWMMDPQLQLLWSGGAPADDRMNELGGIEIGARAWLRARGRMVKTK